MAKTNDDIQLPRLQTKAFDILTETRELEGAHKSEIEQLNAMRNEIAKMSEEYRADLLAFNSLIGRLQISKEGRRAFMSPAEFNEFVEKHSNSSSFGRNQISSLLSFFGRYRTKNPKADPRKIVRKYVRGLSML
jgi:hypothetical protein